MLGFFSKYLRSRSDSFRVVLRNGFWRFASNGMAKIIRLGVLLGAARVLGPEHFGVYAYALSLASLAFLFAEWGMNAIIIREVNQNPEVSTTPISAFGVKLISTAISFLVGVGIFVFVEQGAYLSVGIGLLAALAASNLSETFISLLIGKQRGELEFIVALVEIGVLVACIAPLLWLHSLTVETLAWSFTGAALAAFCTSAAVSFIAVKLPMQMPSREEMRRLFWAGLPMAWFGIIGYGFFSVDQLFLKHHLGLAAVGEYAFATRIIYSSLIVPSIIASVLLPVFARSVAQKSGARKMFRNGLLGMAIPAGAIVLGALFLAEPVIRMVAPEYASVTPVLLRLSFLAVPLYFLVWIDNTLTMMHRQWANLASTLVAVALNIGLNAVLVPRYGMQGSLLATGISQCLNLVCTLWIARRAFRSLGIES